jgi:hypothetical protein
MHQKNPIRSTTPALSPARPRLLQRTCSCGGKSSSGGECESCKKKAMQRRASGGVEAATAPPLVHQVLRSPGQPLDAATRAFFEQRFGHDFSKVRIHADAQANESAQSVNALAYTVGSQIVLGSGAGSDKQSDTELLAHELTHVVQQSQADENASSLQVGAIDSPFEKEADRMAGAVVSNQPGASPAHAATQAIQRAPAQTPAQTPAQAPAQTQTQTPAQAPAETGWGSKKFEGFENDWNAFYQLAIQGLAGGNLKPEKMPEIAKTVADLSMLRCFSHGKQSQCARAVAPKDNNSQATLDMVLPWGANALWGMTFRSALQSTTSGVDGPKTAHKAVERAADIADQATRGMLGDALWKIFMNCKNADASSAPAKPATSPAPAPKAAVPVA